MLEYYVAERRAKIDNRRRLALRNVPQPGPPRSRAHRPSLWSNIAATLGRWPVAAQLAFAAVMLFVAIGGAWLIGWGSGRIVMALVGPATPVAPTPMPNASVATPAAPVIVAVSVSPVHVRSAERAAATVIVKAGTDIVRLHLQGERGESASANLRAIVRSAGGEEVWRGPATSDPAALARVDVPAARLHPDDYMVQLLRTTASGQVERHRYFVRVRPASAR